VYASESGLKLFELESITQIFNESQSRAIGVGVRCSNAENGLESFVEVSNNESQLTEIGVDGSNNENGNENDWKELLHVNTSSVLPSFRIKRENVFMLKSFIHHNVLKVEILAFHLFYISYVSMMKIWIVKRYDRTTTEIGK